MAHTLQLGDIEVELAHLCRQYRVKELSVFGSVARGEMRPGSDIDLLVEFLPYTGIDLVDYAGLMLALSALFGRKVDLVSKKTITSHTRFNLRRSTGVVCGRNGCISTI